MQRKKCPVCKTEVASKCRSCPECGYNFYKRNKKDKDSKINSRQLTFKRSPSIQEDMVTNSEMHNLIILINKKLDEILQISNSKIGFSTEKYLKRIDTKLSLLINKEPRKTWVRATVISDVTGWHDHALQKARRNNLIECRKKGNRFEYCLESLPKLFIKNTKLGGDSF